MFYNLGAWSFGHSECNRVKDYGVLAILIAINSLEFLAVLSAVGLNILPFHRNSMSISNKRGVALYLNYIFVFKNYCS